MVNEPPVDDVRALWQGQKVEGDRMSASDVRRKSEELLQKVRRRSTAMYVIGAANAGFPLVLMWFLPGLRLGLGYLVFTAAMLVFYVRRRNAVRAISPDMTAVQGRTFYRHLLGRERDFQRESARWFTIGPALNIIVLTVVYISSPIFHGTPAELAFIAAVLATHVFILARLARRFAAEARRFQSVLDEV